LGSNAHPRKHASRAHRGDGAKLLEAYIARRANLPQVDKIAETPNRVHIPGRPASIRGALRDRHERGKRDAMDAERRETNVVTRTAKACGPGTPGLVLSLRDRDVGPIGPDALCFAGDGD